MFSISVTLKPKLLSFCKLCVSVCERVCVSVFVCVCVRVCVCALVCVLVDVPIPLSFCRYSHCTDLENFEDKVISCYQFEEDKAEVKNALGL